ncbi:uncharacterized protein BP5553_08003 [Venustampulla echinocandica]|uniref:TPR-like protein n=1 Tax=Venustampulla echinocandica TaxID=2656787 RepID=A0A370TFG0_9HELO|nr:uncharacterized protein BP5553_08003 [Venustampulla echinocandica]RDL33635.1 hypothetical protein BP5553_08003 [Venustampulla echinocandica]
MLERTAGCLEPASLWRLLPASKKSLSRRRTLHPAFWNHATGALELSPLWAALVTSSDTQLEEIAPERRGSGSSRDKFLGILYPPGTTNFLRHYPGWVSDRQDCRRRARLAKLGQRSYSSSANDASTTVVVEPPEDGTEVRGIQGDIVGDGLLRNKLGLDEPYDCDEAWRKYLSLDETSQKLARNIMMEYFSLSRKKREAERIIDLFNGLDLENRDARAYHYAIRAHLKLQNQEGACQLYETVLSSLRLPVGSDELLAYLMKSASWETARDIWSSARQLLKQYPNRRFKIYAVLKQQPNYGDLLCQLAEHANNTMKDAAQDANEDPLGVLNFAKDLVERALMGGHSLSPTTLDTLLGYLHQWDALSPKALQRAVTKLFELDALPLAVQWYRKLNGEKDFSFTRTTLHTLLKFFCVNQHTRGMQQVLDDFFRYHGKPSLPAYKMCMTEFACQGDVETVHGLFDQLIDHHTSHEHPLNDPDYIAPILHVHSKRGEIAKVIKTFNEITEKHNLQPSILCWNILIGAYGRVHDVDTAFATFESVLSSSDLEPNDHTFATVMGIAVSRGDLERVAELHKLAADLNVKNNYAMVDCVVQAHIQNNDLSTAENVCEKAATLDLDGSPTRMWNYLIVAYALRRDLENANRIRRRMSELQIKDDQYTYGAIMQALSMVGQPDQAYRILKHSIPDAGFKVTNFHYAVLMGGYLAVGNVAKVFRLYDDCVGRNIPQSASTNLLLMKATVRPNSHLLEHNPEGGMFQRAIDMFLNMGTQTPQISEGPEKGTSSLPLDIAYPAALHSYLMYVAAQQGELQTARDLYERYKLVVPEDRRNDPPLQIISALMATKWQERDLGGVQECWELALARAQQAAVQPRHLPRSLSQSDNLASEDSGRIPYHRQLDLAKCVSWYLQSLGLQGNVDQMAVTIDDLLKIGFVLDNHNWNIYVKVLCSKSKAKLAFQVCEDRLMPGFTGWSHIRRQLPVRNRLPIEIRRLRKDPRYCRPAPSTILVLADVYLMIQDAAIESPASQYLLEEIRRSCPKTVSAMETMPRTNDPMEREILGEQ